jgi:HAD superfamily hydrolase (TIGR01509 family)
MINAVIFDMDGLLLDSEPFWKEAEIKLFNELGVPLTSEMCDSTVGMRIEEVVKRWHSIYPWDTNKQNASFEKVTENVIQNVIGLINEKAKPFEGVDYIIKFFKQKDIKTAIASSSDTKIIDAVLDKFEIRKEFDVIHSAQFEEFGKPNPAVYLSTAKLLEVKPQDCLTFEDSYNGLIAAKDAGMKTVIIPENRNFDDSRLDIADIKLASLKEFNTKHLEILNNL